MGTAASAMRDDEMRALASAHGIATAYDDAAGIHHDAPPAALAALLDAMAPHWRDGDGVEAPERLLPPVIVVPAGSPVDIDFDGDAVRERPRHWSLLLEDGSCIRGIVADMQCVLRLPGELPTGYHHLALTNDAGVEDPASRTLVAVCPHRCYRPDAMVAQRRMWGIAVQLYALRSVRNWGIGDFSDLAGLMDVAGSAGAALVGLNPLHALFIGNPEAASPYSPSERAALNPLYLDVEAVPDFAECADVQRDVATPQHQANLARLREMPLVDYTAVAEAKLGFLERLYAHFRRCHIALQSPRSHAFREFQAAGGERLRQHAIFEALCEHRRRLDPACADRCAWPSAPCAPDSAAIIDFAQSHAERVEYHLYLQWNAELQLQHACERARASRMPIGLYRDLAVGVDPGGAEAWMFAALHPRGVSIGAPADPFNAAGQDWGLLPCIPAELRAAAYAPFIAVLRANMRHAGALRIDHIMGLLRLFWIPAGRGPQGGTYVHYPLDDLLGILALESCRQRCVVIGEDLGTVPPAIRDAMKRYGILSYRPLYFERTDGGGFAPPSAYPSDALVVASTHDLPTLAGYWEGADVRARDSLGLLPAMVRDQQLAERADDRIRLLDALRSADLLPAVVEPSAPPLQLDSCLSLAIHRFLAATPSAIVVVQMEDVLGQREQVNLPSTTEAMYPNWRRKLALPLEQWNDDPRVQQAFAALRDER
jgi:4-alpha-glucanotransferase/(1->4)-alpha-D-glucan 1-alpha-D-glucosylmutase